MGMAGLARMDDRLAARDEVHHRARGTDASGRSLQLLVVNLSPHGLMARCEQAITDGDPVTITLPVVGPIRAKVIWALGGRFGCQFDQPVPLARYYELLSVLLKS